MNKLKKLNRRGNRTGMTPGTQENLAKTQWPPGESGNPLGKPKGKTFKTVIAEVLELAVTEKNFEGDDALMIAKLQTILGRKPIYRELMAYRQVVKAIAGDTYAFNAIADREEGRPKQAVEIDGSVVVQEGPKVTQIDLEERKKQIEGKK